jgi:hypothetical protein
MLTIIGFEKLKGLYEVSYVSADECSTYYLVMLTYMGKDYTCYINRLTSTYSIGHSGVGGWDIESEAVIPLSCIRSPNGFVLYILKRIERYVDANKTKV